MDERLVHFIRKHVKRGVHHDSIRSFLLSRGYEMELIEEHIIHVLSLERNKKRITAGVIAAIALAILFAGFYNFFGLSKKTGSTDTSGDAQAKYQKDLETFNKALISSDAAGCDKISEQSLKDKCQNKFSFAAPDAKINNSNESVSSALNKELLNKALIGHNASICNEISDDAVKAQCRKILNK